MNNKRNDLLKELNEIKQNSVDVYDALTYLKVYKDDKNVLFTPKEYNHFLYGIKTAAKKCNLRIYRDKIYCNNSLLSTYLPMINGVTEVKLPDGEVVTVINFYLFIPKLINLGPIIKKTKKGNIKELVIDKKSGLRWKKVEKEPQGEYFYFLIPATDNNYHTFIFGNNLKLYTNDFKKYLAQNNVVKRYPQSLCLENTNIHKNYVDYELLLRPFYKTTEFRRSMTKNLEYFDIIDEIFRENFNIKKSNPVFNFCDKDFGQFMLSLKERFVKENHNEVDKNNIKLCDTISTYLGWEYSNYLYKYFPDKNIADLKNMIEVNINNHANNIIYQQQLRQPKSFIEKYSDIEQIYKYNSNEKFDYDFMKDLSETEVLNFSIALFSILQGFFKMADINDESKIVYENQNQLHRSIVYVYYNFINYITERLNISCKAETIKAPVPKELIKQIKRNYRYARKILANDEEKDQVKINELSYLLASLFTFKDMLEKNKNINVPTNDIIERAVYVFKSQLTIPLKRNLESEEEVCFLFKEFIEQLKNDDKIGKTLVLRDTTKISDEDKNETLSEKLIGWYDSKKEKILYLDYIRYFKLFEKFLDLRNINLTLSQGKLQRLYLYKQRIIIPESRSKVPKFQCKRVIVSGEDKKSVLCIDTQKLNNI